LIGASKASGADFRAARFIVFRAGLFAAVRAPAFLAFFDFFAMGALVAQFTREATMTRLLAVVLVALTLQSAPSAQAPAVIGTWKLISYETETPDGKRTFPLGQDVEGLAVYLPNGRVSIQFMKRDRPRFESGDAWRGTFEEERAAFRGFFSYAGRYTLDQARSLVTHHLEIAAAPNYVGTDLVRTFAIAGNRLTLKTPQRQLAGQTSSSTLVWERVD
jgi:hypothetical protein